MAEKPRDACFSSIRNKVKIAFVRYPLEDFTGYEQKSVKDGVFEGVGHFKDTF